MSEIYQASIGGKLNLKGGDSLGVLKKKKKKSKEDKVRLEEAVTRTIDDAGNGGGGDSNKPKAPPVRKTKAELAFEETQRKRQQERIQKNLAKSHKDRVQEFNERLERQTEHFDIPKGEILGMTGLGMLNFSGLSPLIKQSATDGSYSLKTIFDISYTDNPLFNTSASTVYAASGNNLSLAMDAQYAVGDYMFQVTRYTRSQYTWLIVSGAPSSDYLADNILLQDRLADQLVTASRTIIIIAVVLVVLMSAASLVFTEYLILKPFHLMIIAMDKATKFDFSSVRDGSLKEKSISYMAEIQNVQVHFLEMLTAFSNAIKR
ncbi:hypothetical protein HDU93_006130 [Gonapodya sp. JEL0774]|nr:hypothetical protein HDU93_006130 [Gonapodya sp. JEL0774]